MSIMSGTSVKIKLVLFSVVIGINFEKNFCFLVTLYQIFLHKKKT